MIVQFFTPHQISPCQLDKYLAEAWFRSANMLYKAKLLCMNGQIFSLIHTRINLENYQYSKTNRKILMKGLKDFSYIIQPAQIDVQRERLYQLHKKRFLGYVMPNLESFFEKPNLCFETYEVAIFDQNKLIALSYFDRGTDSLAGLMGLFDPDYGRYSLGFLTMLLEINYAISLQKKYYYPGYVLHRPSVFDYKLRLGNIEFYDWHESIWKNEFPQKPQLADILENKIALAYQELLEDNILSQKIFYPPFSLGYLPQFSGLLIRSSLFLMLTTYPNVWQSTLLLEYICEQNIYRLSVAHTSGEYTAAPIQYKDQESSSTKYYKEILVYDHIVCEEENFEDILPKLKTTLALSYFEKIRPSKLS